MEIIEGCYILSESREENVNMTDTQLDQVIMMKSLLRDNFNEFSDKFPK